MFICRKGHESERTPSGRCRQCEKERGRRYRDAHPEIRKEKVERQRKYVARMKLENPEKWKDAQSRRMREFKSRHPANIFNMYRRRYNEKRQAAYVALKELGIKV